MNAFDLLEQQGFLDSLSNTNRIIYLRRKTSNLLRSWIIFQSFCLNIDIIRFRVQARDYEPFNSSTSNSSAVLALKKEFILDCLDISILILSM